MFWLCSVVLASWVLVSWVLVSYCSALLSPSHLISRFRVIIKLIQMYFSICPYQQIDYSAVRRTRY